MFRRVLILAFLCVSAGTMLAQDLSNIQIHGFVTQGFVYSSHNNLYTMETSDGSARWTDAAISFSDAISDNFHIGAQFHVYQLGQLGGPNLQIDWATGDYHVNDRVKIVAGKVKTVYGLFNDSQDVDTVHLWTLLPESFYPVDNKNFTLSHYGADFYGTADLGKGHGKVSYRAYGGYRSLDLNGGYALQLGVPEVGSAFTTGGGNIFGADLRWQTPLKGLLVGASIIETDLNGTAQTGSIHIPYLSEPVEFVKFERGKFMAASEYKRTAAAFDIHLNNVDPYGYPAPVIPYNALSSFDDRSWYVMSAYRLTGKLQVGAYYSHQGAAGVNGKLPVNYSNDAVISGRYDFNSYFYAKVEGHFINGTALDYYVQTNPNGETTATQMLAAKIGFSF